MTINKFMCCLTGTVFMFMSAVLPVHAAMVSTENVLLLNQQQSHQQRIQALLNQDEAHKMLELQGISSQEAQARLDVMTPEELDYFVKNLDEMPAGEGLLSTLVFLFLVLLVTDILGYTDIFPFVVKGRRY